MQISVQHHQEDSLDESKSRADKRAVRAQPRTGGRWARGFRCDPGRWLLLLRNFFRRWYTLGLLLIVAMCLHADQNLAAPNLSAIAEDFDLTPLEKDSKLGGQVQLGFLANLDSWAKGIQLSQPRPRNGDGATSLALGPLADRLNRVNLLLAVVILGSVPCALIKYIPSGDSGFLWYFLCRVLTGVSVGGSFPLLYSLCGDLATPEQRGLVSAAMGVATSIGVATGPGVRARVRPKEAYHAEKEAFNEEPQPESVASVVSEVYERNPSHAEKNISTEFSEVQAAVDGHAAITDCNRFGLMNGEILEVAIDATSSVMDLKEKIAALAPSPQQTQAYTICQQLSDDSGSILPDTQVIGSLVHEGTEIRLKPGIAQSLKAIHALTGHRLQSHPEAFLKEANSLSREVIVDTVAILSKMSSVEESEEVLQLFLTSLEQKSWEVREAGLQGLIDLKSTRKEQKLRETIKELLAAQDEEEEPSPTFSACRALGQLLLPGDEGGIEILRLALESMRSFRDESQKILSLRIILGSLGHLPWTCKSDSGKAARREIMEHYCHLSHLVMFPDIRSFAARRRPNWTHVLRPVALHIGRAAPVLPPQAYKATVHGMAGSENHWHYWGYRQHLAPKAVRAALRELLASQPPGASPCSPAAPEVLTWLENTYDEVRSAGAVILLRRYGDDAWRILTVS
eukprot:g22540.t1